MTQRTTPTEFIYECICEDEPCTCHADTRPDDLVHVEVDPDGNTHIWPHTGAKLYHPEWTDSGRQPEPPTYRSREGRNPTPHGPRPTNR